MTGKIRLSSTSASRKVLALEFIRRFFNDFGNSPSLSEIAAALQTNKSRVHGILHDLASDGHIRLEPGRSRGITLPDRSDEMAESEVLRRLKRLGWTINPSARSVSPALASRPIVTNPELPIPRALDHIENIAGAGDVTNGDDGKSE